MANGGNEPEKLDDGLLGEVQKEVGPPAEELADLQRIVPGYAWLLALAELFKRCDKEDTPPSRT